MNQFKIQDSYADRVETDSFVFEGQLIEGGAGVGMKFQVPDGGHTWELLIRSIKFIPRAGGCQIVGLMVKNADPAYLAGLGAGLTVELYEE